MVLLWQKVWIRRSDGFFKLGIADSLVSIQIETPDDSNKLWLKGLVPHFLKENSETALIDIAKSCLINSFEDAACTEIVRALQFFP